MPHFEIEADDYTGREPTTFTMRGKTVDGGTWDETFTCGSHLPALALSNLMTGITFTPDGKRKFAVPSMIVFMLGALRRWERLPYDEAVEAGRVGDDDKPDDDGLVRVRASDRDRFAELMDDSDRMLEASDLANLVERLTEVLAERPTRPSGT